MNDTKRLEWLQQDTSRLQEVYWRIKVTGGTVREAIDSLASQQPREWTVEEILAREG